MNHQDELLIKGFLNGIKDCIWLHDDESAQKLINKRFPRKVFKRFWNGSYVTDYWFFKNKDVKNEFIKLNIHNKLKSSTFDHSSMGTILGFPPKSVEIFSANIYIHSDKIGVDYCGMHYMAYKQSIEEDLHWLFASRKPPLNKGFQIELSFYDDNICKTLHYYIDEIKDVNEIIKDVLRIKEKLS